MDTEWFNTMDKLKCFLIYNSRLPIINSSNFKERELALWYYSHTYSYKSLSLEKKQKFRDLTNFYGVSLLISSFIKNGKVGEADFNYESEDFTKIISFYEKEQILAKGTKYRSTI